MDIKQLEIVKCGCCYAIGSHVMHMCAHLFIKLLWLLSFYFQVMLIKYSLVEIFPFHYFSSLVHILNYPNSSLETGKHKQFDHALYTSLTLKIFWVGENVFPLNIWN